VRELLHKDIKDIKNEIKDFMVKNKKMAALSGAGLAVIIIALVFFLTMNTEEKTAADNSPETQQQPVYSYLPENTRVTGERGEVRDPFTGALTLKGVITGGDEDNVAIIEAGNISYVARKGTVIAGSWTVDAINSDSVNLKAGDKKLRLDFNGRVKTENTEPAVKNGEKEPEKKDIEPKDTEQKETGSPVMGQALGDAGSGSAANDLRPAQTADAADESRKNTDPKQADAANGGGE
jgi:hypothetical protein